MGLDMYAEEIISHYEHPHNKGKMDSPSISFQDDNPVCGDQITVYLKINKDKKIIEDVKFDGSGCAISMGTASMLTDDIKGKSITEVAKMNTSSVIELIGVDPGPVRIKCANLSLRAIQKAISIYEHAQT